MQSTSPDSKGEITVNSQSVAFSKEFDLSRDAVLVKLKISQVGVTANSKTLSREASVKHEADRNSVKGYVQKIKWTDLSDLTRVYNEAREVLNRLTLPWSEEFRLCPVDNYAELTKAMRELENRFNDSVHKLVSKHSALEEDYQARVKDLSKEIAFPTKAQMEASFSFKFEEALIPSSDIRLRHVSEDTRKEISGRIKAQVNSQLAEAQKEIITRLSAVVSRIAQGTREDGKLHSSAIDALNSTLEAIPSLNITNDPDIASLVSRVKTQLGDLDVKELRKDEAVKSAVAASASSILGDLKKFESK